MSTAVPFGAEGPRPQSNWAGPVIDFLMRHNHTDGVPGEWRHAFMSAPQMACMALVALGQADETAWGAIRRANPVLPDRMPRWDDICIAVLGLGCQTGLLDYRLRDGVEPPAPRAGTFVVRRIGAPPPAPNVAPGIGTGPAHASADLLPVLDHLGLVAQGSWTSAAETVLWREAPRAWAIDFAADPRFLAAIETAVATVPGDIRAELARLSRIGAADLAEHQAQIARAVDEMRARFGEHARHQPIPDDAQARRSVESGRRNALDWLFFRRWRLSDGWLSPARGPVALEIFHDPLAIAMRRAVMRRLHPEAPFASLWRSPVRGSVAPGPGQVLSPS